MKSEWNEIMRVQCQSKTSRTPQIGKHGAHGGDNP